MSEQKENEFDPKYLGKQVTTGEDIDLIPWEFPPMRIELGCSEFTSICPITGQPDFGKISIRYIPNKYIIETKSLKFYMRKFRTVKSFNERLVSLICEELWDALQPYQLEVEGNFNTRGGITVKATANKMRKQALPSIVTPQPALKL